MYARPLNLLHHGILIHSSVRSSASTSYRLSNRRSRSTHDFTVSVCADEVHHRFGWFWECPNGENCHYRHALPPGFTLKSQRKALEDAEKANTISLEEFLEVEVSCYPFGTTTCILTVILSLAAQARLQSDASHTGDIRKMEADAYEQEASRRGGDEEGKGYTGCGREELGHEWTRSCECHH